MKNFYNAAAILQMSEETPGNAITYFYQGSNFSSAKLSKKVFVYVLCVCLAFKKFCLSRVLLWQHEKKSTSFLLYMEIDCMSTEM